MREIILHHYELSPFGTAMRLALGHKALAWKSVEAQLIAPKPDLSALTGGYERIPVLQIGADIYCDTACITAALEGLMIAKWLRGVSMNKARWYRSKSMLPIRQLSRASWLASTAGESL